MGNKKVENAIIMAAGRSVRFAPISYEYPKPLLEIKGEVLIERQIKQLKEIGIDDITIVVGYKKELFNYLIDKFGVTIVENPEYNIRNNNSTLYHVREKLSNTYICSADNYFQENPFELYMDKAFYSSVYKEGDTSEWCIKTNDAGLIIDADIGGKNSWVMMGHVYFDRSFSNKFVEILEEVYNLEKTAPMLWESIYLENIKKLNLYIRKYSNNTIFEFDTLDELRVFDKTYLTNSRSNIMKTVANLLNTSEKDITDCRPILKDGDPTGFIFRQGNNKYSYDYESKNIVKE